MFENFRERLHTVQQDFSTGMKTLSNKSKRRDGTLPEFSAGGEILNRYEDMWVALHEGGSECARAAEVLDGDVAVLLAHWEKRRAVLIELQEQLREVPNFLSDLASITSHIAHMEADFEEMESLLMHLENLCGQCELQRAKHHQEAQLEGYKKKKRKDLEHLKAELDSEHAQKVVETEHAQQVKLKERQKFFEEAFQQDMEQYLSTGYLQIAERREPIGSMSSMEVNVDMLEQMDLMDMSDHEALDVFLNSGGDDNSVASPMLGPDSEPFPAEITLRVPTQAELRQKLSSLSSTCTDSASPETEGGDGAEPPLVQPDEEEVQADAALAALPEGRPPKDSDDSDSPAT
ncbi:dysbindin-A-like isoform X1 [Anguilla anguilla]|uniref:dysbindin-A-like isoform X1 n=1 Tax=Anguilla anguilla TaxID=7936 RepID=UPI0015ACC62F|nr:dysbindin-A-like isoform X1 [Anguilla anguilla]